MPMIQLSSRGLRKAPVKNTRQHVDQHGRNEHQRGPVVDLAHDQAAADVEGDVQRRGVGLRHLDAAAAAA